MMKIVVTGSLGNISKPLTEDLVQQGHSISVITSNRDKQKAIEALQATALVGKLEDAHFVSSAFAGADAVYCMIPFDFKVEDQEAYFRKIAGNYIQAIKENGVKKAVFLSGWAADVVKSHNISGMLHELPGVAITELRPGSFYTNFYNYIGMIKNHGAIINNYGGDDKVAFVSPIDIAKAAAEELTAPSRGLKVRYIASEELTCNEAAKILGVAIGKPDLQWLTLSDEEVLDNLLKSGVPTQLAKDLVSMSAATHSGAIYENYLHHRPILGNTKLTEFAKEFSIVYNGRK